MNTSMHSTGSAVPIGFRSFAGDDSTIMQARPLEQSFSKQVGGKEAKDISGCEAQKAAQEISFAESELN